MLVLAQKAEWSSCLVVRHDSHFLSFCKNIWVGGGGKRFSRCSSVAFEVNNTASLIQFLFYPLPIAHSHPTPPSHCPASLMRFLSLHMDKGVHIFCRYRVEILSVLILVIRVLRPQSALLDSPNPNSCYGELAFTGSLLPGLSAFPESSQDSLLKHTVCKY